MELKILDTLFQVFGNNPAETLIILIIAGVFLWMTRELRVQLKEERIEHNTKLEKSLEVLSAILTEENRFHSSLDSVDFFKAVYSSLPFIEYQLTKDIFSIIDNEDNSEHEKISQITFKVKKQINVLSNKLNNNLFTSNSYVESAEKFFKKIWKLLAPVVLPFLILYSLSILFLIGMPWENSIVMVLKPMFFIFWIVLLLSTVDLFNEKRIKRNNVWILCLLHLINITIIISPEVYVFYLIVIFILLITLLAYKRIKNIDSEKELESSMNS